MRDEKRELGAQHHSSKNLEKKRKKFLTSWKKCGKLKKFTASFEKTSLSASVPCKLNNVKTNFNTLDNYGLFKRKRKNSQRKFLSNYARSKLFKNLILSLRGFKIQFFESLILAQDERWRRA